MACIPNVKYKRVIYLYGKLSGEHEYNFIHFESELILSKNKEIMCLSLSFIFMAEAFLIRLHYIS